SLFDTRTYPEHLDINLFLRRVPAQMLMVLGPLALVLAAIGLYAVLAYALAQRTQEIGVRLTLGASPRSVVALVMWDGIRVVPHPTRLLPHETSSSRVSVPAPLPAARACHCRDARRRLGGNDSGLRAAQCFSLPAIAVWRRRATRRHLRVLPQGRTPELQPR